MQDFIADLCRLAISCEFGDFLNQALRDRYVCGLKAENIQKKLLAEDNWTIARALELARGMEVAAADAKELKHSSSVPSGKILHASNSGSPANAVCLSCGKSVSVDTGMPSAMLVASQVTSLREVNKGVTTRVTRVHPEPGRPIRWSLHKGKVQKKTRSWAFSQ